MRMTTLLWFFWIHALFSLGVYAAKPTDESIRLRVEELDQTGILIQGERIQNGDVLSVFYARRAFEPVWTHPGERELAIQTLGRADLEGLSPTDYHIQTIEKLAAQPNPTSTEQTDLDILLTDGILLYASHLLTGKVDPSTINAQRHISLRNGDPVRAIENGLYSNQLAKALAQLAPRQTGYLRLKEALVKYSTMYLRDGDWPTIPDGPSIKPGMEDARIPAIRERLRRTEYYSLSLLIGEPDSATAHSVVYDAQLVQAVQQFQTRHGLTAEGVIGKGTLEAMNVSLPDRINQIKANLERWRWLPPQFGPFYLLVNIANYEVQGFRDGKLEVTHKVIVGKPYRKTPVFSSTIQYLVFNPTWTVPPTILSQDVIPATRKDVNYLATKGLNVYDSKGTKLDPATIDWSSPSAKWYTYRQAPGPSNALGTVKFMFPNKYDVYMHDTPSKELFDKDERAFSSGCIRVRDPLGLAAWMLNDSAQWNRQTMESIIAERRSHTVMLPVQPEVHILYLTSWVDNAGIVHFRKDVYERDQPLFNALTASY